MCRDRVMFSNRAMFRGKVMFSDLVGVRDEDSLIYLL